jgi:hypothetical protein
MATTVLNILLTALVALLVIIIINLIIAIGETGYPDIDDE